MNLFDLSCKWPGLTLCLSATLRPQGARQAVTYGWDHHFNPDPSLDSVSITFVAPVRDVLNSISLRGASSEFPGPRNALGAIYLLKACLSHCEVVRLCEDWRIKI